MDAPGHFQFSLKDLFVSLTLLAVGIRSAVVLFDKKFDVSLEVASMLWLVSLPTIGAGIGAPFGKKLLGAYVGVFLALVFFVFMFLVRFVLMADWN